MEQADVPISLLEQVLSLDALKFAWHRVAANKGKPGADGVSVKRFERLLDANLLALADQVRLGGYQPGGVRRVHIRTGRKLRTITILPVRDRVLQRSALDVLLPRIDPQFLPSSFGYRPGRSIQRAVERIVRLRDRGANWVVDADIRDCFGNLDRELLRQFLEPLVPDPGLRRLLNAWIGTRQRGRRVSDHAGIPLGAVISPLFCNVYLHHLDVALQRRRYSTVRYADDFIVVCKSREHAERALRATEKVLRGLKLELNRHKTRVVSFDDGFDFLGVHFEGSDYSYVSNGKRITVDHLPPAFFHYHAESYQ